MTASIPKRVFYTSYKILKKISKTKPNPNVPIRIWDRSSCIIPEHVGYTFEVHNGRSFIKITVNENHVFHKFGEFAPTRKYPGNRAKKNVKI